MRLAAIGPVLLACSRHALGAERYNVLYLIADDLRPEIAGGYGQAQVLTPSLDRLAASGLVFGKAYCQQSVCGPSRNSFMTGRRPHHTNVDGTKTGSNFRVSGMDANGAGSGWITVAGHFKQHNYTTLGGGKTFHPGHPKNFDYPTSWSDWHAQSGFASNYYSFSYWLTSSATKVNYKGPCPGYAKPDANQTPAGLAGPIAVWCALDEPDSHFYDYGLANDTIQRMRYAASIWQKDGTPFFIQSGFARPHTPWRVPQRFWDLYQTDEIVLAKNKLPPPDMPGVAWMAHSFYNASTGAAFPMSITQPLADPVAQLARHAYYASVSFLDHQVGRILDELDALGLQQQTIVVFHGDHGWQLGEHGSWHKYTNFELGTRVPLIMRAPMVPASQGKVAQGLAELVDVYPTLAELAGTPVPSDHLDGVSLVPFIEDPARVSFRTSAGQGTRNKTVAFSQYAHSDGALCPAVACPFFRDGACHQDPAGGADTRPQAVQGNQQWMGFSVRDQTWRYTAWVPYNGTRAQWVTSRNEGLFEELYDHSADHGSDFDAMDTANLAYDSQHVDTAKSFFQIAREFFDVIMPPTSGQETPTPAPEPGCESFCNASKHKDTPWSVKCTWVHCELCPECKHAQRRALRVLAMLRSHPELEALLGGAES